MYRKTFTPITSAEMSWSRIATKALPTLVRKRFLAKRRSSAVSGRTSQKIRRSPSSSSGPSFAAGTEIPFTPPVTFSQWTTVNSTTKWAASVATAR